MQFPGLKTNSSNGRHRAVKRLLPYAGTLAIAGMLLAGCSGTSTSGSHSGGTITVADNSAPSTLNPVGAGNGPDLSYQELAYASLIQQDPHGKLVPGLAKSWGYVGSDNKKFELTLRANMKFADGEPITAKAVAASLNYFAAKGTGPSASAFHLMHATADGALKVVLTTTQSNPVIPSLLSPYFLAGNVIAPKGLNNKKELGTKTFGAGPYVLDNSQTVTGDHYTFVPNANYYDQSQIHYKSFTVKVISDTSSVVQALRSGQVSVGTGDVTTVGAAKSAKLTVLHKPSTWDGAFIIDRTGETTPALASLKVRQALNYAVDRSAITKAVFAPYGTTTDQPNTPGQDAYDPALESKYSYNPTKAKQLLAEAGYSDGFTIKWAYPSFENVTAKVVQAMAADYNAIGIKTELTGAANISEFLTDLRSKQYGLWSFAWGGQSQYANTAQVWLAGGEINPFGQVPDGLAEAFDKYTTASASDSVAAAQAVQAVLVNQAVSVPVSKFDTIVFHNTKVKGVALQDDGLLNNEIYWHD